MLPVRYCTESLEFEGDVELVPGEARDVSPQGLFVRSDFLESPGTTVHLHLSLPREAEPLRLCGHVAWVTEDPELGPGMGICIEDAPKGRHLIDCLLADLGSDLIRAR